jgi:hypothetical protein
VLGVPRGIATTERVGVLAEVVVAAGSGVCDDGSAVGAAVDRGSGLGTATACEAPHPLSAVDNATPAVVSTSTGRAKCGIRVMRMSR